MCWKWAKTHTRGIGQECPLCLGNEIVITVIVVVIIVVVVVVVWHSGCYS